MKSTKRKTNGTLLGAAGNMLNLANDQKGEKENVIDLKGRPGSSAGTTTTFSATKPPQP